jgi:restriction endonuclease Mrr
MNRDTKHDAWEKIIENIEEIQTRVDEEIIKAENNFISHDEDIDWNNAEEAGYIDAFVDLKNNGYIDSEDLEMHDLERVNSTLHTLRYSVINKATENLRTSLDELYETLEEMNLSISKDEKVGQDIWDDTYALIDMVESSGIQLIFENRKEIIQIPDLLLQVNNSLFKLLEKEPKKIFEIPPRLFEEMIAEIFFKNGFYVELTKATRDGGRDIIAIRNNLDIQTKYIIECKRYAPHNKVDLAIVQRLLGVKIGDAANQAILATTSTFTADAMNFVKQRCIWDLALKEYNDVMAWIHAYNRS